ncbi:MAG: ATP-binding protein [Planctomycetia bacterium]|nr:ATP-binding protein [Planctomycetia bacterium]
MRNIRLFWRLFSSYLWITVVALVFVAWSGSSVLRDFYLDQVARELENGAYLCRPEVASLLASDDLEAMDRLCKSLGKATQTRITVILPSGKVVGDTEEDPRRMDNHRDRPEVAEALAGGVGRVTRTSDTVREELLYVAVGLERHDAIPAVVRLAVPLTEVNRTLRSVRVHFLVVGALAAGFVAIVSLWVSRRISRPLEHLETGARRLAGGELDHRLDTSDIAEIAALADAMNQMAEQWADRVRTILRQQNEQAAMLSSMVEGVLAVDNAGTVITLNESCAALVGAEAAKVKGRKVHEVIRKPDLLRFVESALSSPSPVEGDLEIAGATSRWLHAYGTTLDDAEGRQLGALIVFHDVTQLRRLEMVRRDFVANVSHELRTPITSIKGFVETLLDGALDDKASATRFLEIIHRQANRLDAIIEDLLMLSRLEKAADEPAEPFSPDAVAEMLRAAVEMCQNRAAENRISIEVACEETLTVPMNAQLLEQAIVNLLDNAIKYSSPGATVRVEAAREADEVVIRVRDHGCGIESRYLPRLFERFYRVDRARSRELGGTGLGLAIVKHIILVHGGSVDVESTVGQGSTFTIHLPAAKLTNS